MPALRILVVSIMTWGQLLFLVSSLTAGFGYVEYNYGCCDHEEPADETPAIEAIPVITEAIEPEAIEILVPTTIRDEVLEPRMWNPVVVTYYNHKTGEPVTQKFDALLLPKPGGGAFLTAHYGDY